MKALLWSVATYVCESWILRKNEETRLDAFEMKGLRKILQVSWTEKKTNEWVLNKAGVKRELLDTVKARKLAYYGHTMKQQGSCLEKEKRGTMLFGKYLMHIGMKVSNRCSIIAPVSLYPSCYPWRNCYFGRKCCVVVIWFCADWQSVVMPVSSLWQRNSTLNLTTLLALVLRVLRTAFGFIFLN